MKRGAPIIPKHRPNALKEHREAKLYLESLGYKVYSKGWPDFLCEMNGVLLAIEVKRSNKIDQLRPEQIQVMGILKKKFPCFLMRKNTLIPF